MKRTAPTVARHKMSRANQIDALLFLGAILFFTIMYLTPGLVAALDLPWAHVKAIRSISGLVAIIHLGLLHYRWFWQRKGDEK